MRLLPLVLVLTAPAAFAQDMAFDHAYVERCLASGAGAKCINVASDHCMQTNPGGQTTVGMGYCLDAEWQAWDRRLNATYARMLAQAQAEDADLNSSAVPRQAPALKAMQRAWITFRDRKCDWARSLWGGGTGGGPATASCLLTETARQVLYLEESGLN